MCSLVFLAPKLEVLHFRMFSIIIIFYFFVREKTKTSATKCCDIFFFSFCSPKCKIFSNLETSPSILHKLTFDSSVLSSDRHLWARPLL